MTKVNRTGARLGGRNSDELGLTLFVNAVCHPASCNVGARFIPAVGYLGRPLINGHEGVKVVVEMCAYLVGTRSDPGPTGEIAMKRLNRTFLRQMTLRTYCYAILNDVELIECLTRGRQSLR